MSQAQLARALAVQQNVVARLEDGGRADPRLSTVVAVSRALGVSVDTLLAEAGMTEKPLAAQALQDHAFELSRVARLAREQLAALDESLAALEPTRRTVRTSAKAVAAKKARRT